MSKRESDQQGGSGAKRARAGESTDLPPVNAIFHGEVASVQKYGVFVKLPGYDRHGLVHVSQMSSARIEDPSEMLAKGEKVFCKVISVDADTTRFQLSMKLVNQTSGKDLDPNNVQASLDEKKKRKFGGSNRAPIELGAVYDTVCRTCGGRGHMAMNCFVGKGGKQYDLVPELEDMVPSDDPEPPPKESSHKKKKKKEKKHKKEKKKKKKRHHSDSSDNSDSDSDRERDSRHRRKSSHKHRS